MSRSLSITVRTYETAKSGSTPEEQLPMIESVPVGAMVVTVALRVGHRQASRRSTLRSSGSTPRSSASLFDAARASAWMKPMTFSPRADRLLGVVGDLQLDEHVGPAHDAETDLAVASAISSILASG